MAQADDLSALRNRSRAATDQLAEEQHESVMSLAHVLDTISATESVAHIESRVAFLERQLELLAERKDEVDQAISSDLGLMRARVEDALNAIAETSRAQESLGTVLEERLAEALELSERKILRSVQRMSTPSQSDAEGQQSYAGDLGREVSRLGIKVDELISRVSSAQARWSSERMHFETLLGGLTQRLEALERGQRAS